LARQMAPYEAAYKQALTAQAMAHPDIARQQLAVQMRGQDVQMRGQDIQNAHNKAMEDINHGELTVRQQLADAETKRDIALARKALAELSQLEDSRRILEEWQPTGDILQDLPTLMRVHPAAASSYITHMLGGNESAKTRWVQYLAKTLGIPEAQALNIVLNSSDNDLFNRLAASDPVLANKPDRLKTIFENLQSIKRELIGTTGPPAQTSSRQTVRKQIPTLGGLKAMRAPDGSTVYMDPSNPMRQFKKDPAGQLVPVK